MQKKNLVVVRNTHQFTEQGFTGISNPNEILTAMAHLYKSDSLIIEVDNILSSLQKYLIGQGSRTSAEIINAVRHEKIPPNFVLL